MLLAANTTQLKLGRKTLVPGTYPLLPRTKKKKKNLKGAYYHAVGTDMHTPYYYIAN